MIDSVESGTQIQNNEKGYFLFVYVGEYITLEKERLKI